MLIMHTIIFSPEIFQINGCGLLWANLVAPKELLNPNNLNINLVVLVDFEKCHKFRPSEIGFEYATRDLRIADNIILLDMCQ
jgi:hypothetical protein